MAQACHLENAPIAEAVIDFRVPILSQFSDERFQWLVGKVGDEGYGHPEDLKHYSGEITLAHDKPVESYIRDEGLYGCRFRSQDGRNLIQFRRDGFIFNRLRPYTNWQDISTEARKFWDLYTEWARPEVVERLAVRYINHLKLPSFNLTEYLVALPSAPSGLPGNVSKFFSQIIIHDPIKDLNLGLTQAVLDNEDADLPTIVLDIDVFKVEKLKSHDQRIWQIFEQLHDLKNEAFFNSITDNTVRLYQ